MVTSIALSRLDLYRSGGEDTDGYGVSESLLQLAADRWTTAMALGENRNYAVLICHPEGWPNVFRDPVIEFVRSLSNPIVLVMCGSTRGRQDITIPLLPPVGQVPRHHDTVVAVCRENLQRSYNHGILGMISNGL
jgi:hypothetical protein